MMTMQISTPNLQTAYQSLSKKQKGIVMESILSDANFTRSKEWLRKYINGAYDKSEESVEKIGLATILSLGIEMPSSLPLRSSTKVIEPPVIHQVQSSEREKIIQTELNPSNESISQAPLPQGSVSVFDEILRKGMDSTSLSQVGQLWYQFSRACRASTFNKENPFNKMTELLSDTDCKDLLIADELRQLYLDHLNSTKEFSFLSAWELFGLKARFNYKVNPFQIIQNIIYTTKNSQ